MICDYTMSSATMMQIFMGRFFSNILSSCLVSPPMSTMEDAPGHGLIHGTAFEIDESTVTKDIKRHRRSPLLGKARGKNFTSWGSRSQGVKNKGLEWTERTWHDMTNLDDISSISLESHLLPYKCHRVAAQPGTISHNPQLTEIQLTFPDIFLMPPSSRTPNSLWSWFESMTFYETIMEHAVFFCTFLFWCHLPICFSPFCHGLSFDLSQVAAWRQVKQGETWTAASLKNFKI